MKYLFWILVGISLGLNGAYWWFYLQQQGTPWLPIDHSIKYVGASVSILLGIGISHAALLFLHQAGRKASLTTQHPGSPWLWRDDWAQGVSRAEIGGRLFTLYFVLFWCITVLPIIGTSYPKLKAEAEPLFLYVFGYGFPLITVLMVITEIRRWQQHLRVRKQVLKLEQAVTEPGENLRCSFEVPPVKHQLQWNAHILCIYSFVETTRNSDGRTSCHVEKVLWQGEGHISNSDATAGEPLQIQLPTRGEYPVTGKYQDGEVHWLVRLEAKKKNGQSWLRKEFAVPVFSHGLELSPGAAAKSEPQLFEKVGEAPREKPGTVAERISWLAEHGIQFSKTGIRYDESLWRSGFGYSAGPAFAIIGAILAMATAAVAFHLLVNKQEYFSGLVFSFAAVFCLLFVILGIYLRFHRYHIRFDRHGLHRQSNLFSWQWRWSMPWAQIKHFEVRENSASNDRDGRRVGYHQVVLSDCSPLPMQNGKRISLQFIKRNFALCPALKDRDLPDNLSQLLTVVQVQAAKG